jgi:uridylate kinase
MDNEETPQRFRRVLLKLSGEVFRQPETGECLDPARFADTARRLKIAHDHGTELAIVIGGGNIFRGYEGESLGTDRVRGDTMGMLATMINSLSLEAALHRAGVRATTLAAVDMPRVAPLFTRDRAQRLLDAGHVVILGGGTGNPFFTTDTAAALRAAELGADALFKATKVNGIYTADPHKDPTATQYKVLTYTDALQRRLKVMDAAAFALCMDNHIPILVFNFFDENEMTRAFDGKAAGTLVCA